MESLKVILAFAFVAVMFFGLFTIHRKNKNCCYKRQRDELIQQIRQLGYEIIEMENFEK